MKKLLKYLEFEPPRTATELAFGNGGRLVRVGDPQRFATLAVAQHLVRVALDLFFEALELGVLFDGLNARVDRVVVLELWLLRLDDLSAKKNGRVVTIQ